MRIRTCPVQTYDPRHTVTTSDIRNIGDPGDVGESSDSPRHLTAFAPHDSTRGFEPPREPGEVQESPIGIPRFE